MFELRVADSDVESDGQWGLRSPSTDGDTCIFRSHVSDFEDSTATRPVKKEQMLQNVCRDSCAAGHTLLDGKSDRETYALSTVIEFQQQEVQLGDELGSGSANQGIQIRNGWGR